jgi:hypothetical protein
MGKTNLTSGDVSSRALSTVRSDVMSSRSVDLTRDSLGIDSAGTNAATVDDEQLSGWSQEVTDPFVSTSKSNSELDCDESRDVRPVSRAISHIGCSPTLTQRLKAAQTARRTTQGYRNATKNGPNALQSVRVKDSLPVLEAAVHEAALAAGVHVSPRHADKTVGGQAPVTGKAAVQWQEWLRKEKGIKLELTPIGAAGLAHTLQQQGGADIDKAASAAAAFAKFDLQGTTAGRKIVRKKTDRRTPTVSSAAKLALSDHAGGFSSNQPIELKSPLNGFVSSKLGLACILERYLAALLLTQQFVCTMEQERKRSARSLRGNHGELRGQESQESDSFNSDAPSVMSDASDGKTGLMSW